MSQFNIGTASANAFNLSDIYIITELYPVTFSHLAIRREGRSDWGTALSILWSVNITRSLESVRLTIDWNKHIPLQIAPRRWADFFSCSFPQSCFKLNYATCPSTSTDNRAVPKANVKHRRQHCLIFRTLVISGLVPLTIFSYEGKRQLFLISRRSYILKTHPKRPINPVKGEAFP